MKLELDAKKVQRMKKASGLTWQQIAKKMGFKHRQQAHRFMIRKNISGAVLFAKVFGCSPKDLILVKRG